MAIVKIRSCWSVHCEFTLVKMGTHAMLLNSEIYIKGMVAPLGELVSFRAVNSLKEVPR